MQTTLFQFSRRVRPIDWGLGYALTHKRSLFALALVPAIIDIISSYLLYSRPLSQQGKFLVIVILGAANAWLISAVLIRVISLLRGSPIGVKKAAIQALRFLPKVFLSYAALISLVLSVVIILPLLFLALFFLWAPGFCVAEMFAKSVREEDDREDVANLFDDEELPKPRRISLFANKSLFELGFARSLQLAARNIGVSLQIALIFWFCKFFPGAIVDIFTTRGMGFAPEVIRILFHYGFEAVAVGVASGAFIFMLPKEARREIGLDEIFQGEDELALPADSIDPTSGRVSGVQLVRFQGRKHLLLILTLVSIVSTLLFGYRMRQSHMIPDNTLVEVSQNNLAGDKLMLELSLVDPNEQFLWLDPLNFRLDHGGQKDLPGLSNQIVEGENPVDSFSSGEVSGEGISQERPLVEPLFFKAFSIDGIEIPESMLTPHSGPLMLQLYFPYSDTLSGKEFQLYYESYFGDRRLVAEGRLRVWSSNE